MIDRLTGGLFLFPGMASQEIRKSADAKIHALRMTGAGAQGTLYVVENLSLRSRCNVLVCEYMKVNPLTVCVSEIDSLFGKMTVASVMTSRVIWVLEDCIPEEAARILVDNKIGSLPVMCSHRIVGMISKADIFRAMMEALGGRANGLRITIRLHEDTGELGAITDGIVQLGGTFSNPSRFWDDDVCNQTVTVKVQGIEPQELISLIERNIGVEVIDYHESGAEYQPQVVSPPENKEAFPIQNLDAEFIRFAD